MTNVRRNLERVHADVMQMRASYGEIPVVAQRISKISRTDKLLFFFFLLSREIILLQHQKSSSLFHISIPTSLQFATGTNVPALFLDQCLTLYFTASTRQNKWQGHSRKRKPVSSLFTLDHVTFCKFPNGVTCVVTNFP